MTDRTTPARWLRLLGFIAGILLIGFAIGMVSNPKASYAAFVKPWFSPPAWVFGPVWSLLYVMIAIAGWRLYERDPASGTMRLWWAQLVLNFLWTPVFFMAQGRAAALLIILILLALIVRLISKTLPEDRITAWLLMPYAAWVAFATVLNGAIVYLN